MIAEGENGMWNDWGNWGGLKSWVFTVTPGCWVTSTSESVSLASGVTGMFCLLSSVTVPVTAVAADAGLPAAPEDPEEPTVADEPPDWLDVPQAARSRVATNKGAATSFRMGIPQKSGTGAPTRSISRSGACAKRGPEFRC